jgi:hypothetical protein
MAQAKRFMRWRKKQNQKTALDSAGNTVLAALFHAAFSVAALVASESNFPGAGTSDVSATQHSFKTQPSLFFREFSYGLFFGHQHLGRKVKARWHYI